MESDFPRLPAFNIQTVNQIVIVVYVSGCRQRRRNLHIEGIDEIVVEVGLQVHASRKLGNRIVLIQT